jgi:hypothetical protein
MGNEGKIDLDACIEQVHAVAYTEGIVRAKALTGLEGYLQISVFVELKNPSRSGTTHAQTTSLFKLDRQPTPIELAEMVDTVFQKARKAKRKYETPEPPAC